LKEAVIPSVDDRDRKTGTMYFSEANPHYSCFGARCPVVHIEGEPESIAWSIVFPVATFSWLSVAILASFQVSSSISTLKPIRIEVK